MTRHNLAEIEIRINLQPGDIGFIIHRHAKIYHEEYGFGASFERYVGEGLIEFHKNYDQHVDRVWVCEHHQKIIGFLLLMHRENHAAQLRYFYLDQEYRGIGLGKKLMSMFMDFLNKKDYHSAYLWTTNELAAATSLYKAHGFKLTQEKHSTVFGKPLIEQRYDLTILKDEVKSSQK
ncbi:MAG: GNAT family N-acetyltransferase [Saprospiraceae bacterium]|nr:GNAT family N-acetyltransferase [Saprospiraceae bacterium]